MVNKVKNQTTTNLPQGRVFRLRELSGWLSKHFQVPPGRLGVVLYPNGESRTFSPGSHRLLSYWDRLTGKGVGLKVGLVPIEPFTVSIKIPYLLSGDGELLDASLVCSLVVSDPARFFGAVVVPQGETSPSQIDLDPSSVQETLGALARRYAAADLIHGVVTSSLIGQLSSSLSTALSQDQGIELQQVLLLILARAEDRAVIAEKAQALKERLQEVDLQAKMAEVESQAQLEEFVQQLDPALANVTHIQVGTDGQGKAKGSLKGRLAEALRGWLNIESGREGGKRRWRIESLFRRKADAEATVGRYKKAVRVPHYWWLPRVVWVLLAILVGVSLTGLINLLASSLSRDNRAGLLVIVWGFVIGVILESIKVLYEKREKYSEDAWMLAGFQHLDELVGNNRQWADEVVRAQCASELNHIREVVSDVRSREYKRGKQSLALKLKNEVERNIDDCVAKIQRQDYGQPPYLSDLHVSRHLWEYSLDKDEDLLLYAHALSDRAHLLQQKSHADQLSDESVAEMDTDVLNFCNRFFERSRPLQMPAEETIRS